MISFITSLLLMAAANAPAKSRDGVISQAFFFARTAQWHFDDVSFLERWRGLARPRWLPEGVAFAPRNYGAELTVSAMINRQR